MREAYLKGHQEGESAGYEKAKAEYEVTYFCWRCRRRHLSITSQEEKESAANLMFEAEWYDPNCPYS